MHDNSPLVSNFQISHSTGSFASVSWQRPTITSFSWKRCTIGSWIHPQWLFTLVQGSLVHIDFQIVEIMNQHMSHVVQIVLFPKNTCLSLHCLRCNWYLVIIHSWYNLTCSVTFWQVDKARPIDHCQKQMFLGNVRWQQQIRRFQEWNQWFGKFGQRTMEHTQGASSLWRMFLLSGYCWHTCKAFQCNCRIEADIHYQALFILVT